MNRGDLRAIYRREVVDVEAPYLWSDDEINEFADDAVMEAVRRGITILDSTTAAVYSYAYEISDPTIVTLDSRVIRIHAAIIEGQTIPLERMKVAVMDRLYPGWRSTTAQYPTIYIDDWSSGAIRLYPSATVAGTVNMTVAREPLCAMASDSDEPEIPARYHRSLIYWMKHRGYSKDDTEAVDSALADKNEKLFALEFGPRRSARNERWQEQEAGLMPDTLC